MDPECVCQSAGIWWRWFRNHTVYIVRQDNKTNVQILSVLNISEFTIFWLPVLPVAQHKNTTESEAN